MKYLSFVRHSESYRKTEPPAALMKAMDDFVRQSRHAGTLIDTGGLLPSSEGARIRLASGEITVTDGPFAESKEVIGGWAMFNADSKEEAIGFGKQFLELHRQHWPGFDGEVELRPMFDLDMGR